MGATVTRTAAWRGGPALAATLAGLAAARTATGTGQPRTTVVAHSYGTVVVDEAADVPGRLAADAVVLLGSPGMEDDAASLEAPEVFDAASAGDVVPRLDWFGDGGTRAPRFGSAGLPVTSAMGHSDYLDPDHPTLAAIGEVVTGTRGARMTGVGNSSECPALVTVAARPRRVALGALSGGVAYRGPPRGRIAATPAGVGGVRLGPRSDAIRQRVPAAQRRPRARPNSAPPQYH